MSKYQYLLANRILENYHRRLSGLRSGRVNSGILENILVEAYGSKMHFHELATITIPEPSQLLITPFDKSVISAMEKAIYDSPLGVSPVNDGAGLRLNFPPLTEETRKARVKDLYKMMEEARIELRQNRQDVLKSKKNEKEEGLLSESEFLVFEKALQEEVDNLNKEIEAITKEKEEELMKV